MSKTMYLPGFSHRLFGRRAAATEAGFLQRKVKRLDGLAALVSRFLRKEVFALGDGQRERVYTPWVTFVAFLGQVLTRGAACREAVRRVQAWCVADKRAAPDESTSAYCQGRARLSIETLRAAHEQIGEWMGRHAQAGWQWCSRSVKVLDGCGVSMPDTAENRAEPAANSHARAGCSTGTEMIHAIILRTQGS